MPPGDKALELMRHAARALGDAGIQEAEKEAELIVSVASGLDRAALYRDDPELSEGSAEKIQMMLMRRAGREPLQYIIGHVDFLGLEIRVGPGVLIPRPETELLAEESLRLLAERGGPLRVLDLCTGSGCLALAVARGLPGARVTATELSGEALAYARENARINGARNVTFLRGHLFEPVRGMTFDAVVSNPPYVKSSEIDGLEPEIRRWEPREALDGGADGMDFFRAVLPAAGPHLRPGGLVALELGQGQAPGVARMARAAGFTDVSVRRDLAGIERVLTAWKPL